MRFWSQYQHAVISGWFYQLPTLVPALRFVRNRFLRRAWLLTITSIAGPWHLYLMVVESNEFTIADCQKPWAYCYVFHFLSLFKPFTPDIFGPQQLCTKILCAGRDRAATFHGPVSVLCFASMWISGRWLLIVPLTGPGRPYIYQCSIRHVCNEIKNQKSSTWTGRMHALMFKCEFSLWIQMYTHVKKITRRRAVTQANAMYMIQPVPTTHDSWRTG
jgi:hypothetical protein